MGPVSVERDFEVTCKFSSLSNFRGPGLVVTSGSRASAVMSECLDKTENTEFTCASLPSMLLSGMDAGVLALDRFSGARAGIAAGSVVVDNGPHAEKSTSDSWKRPTTPSQYPYPLRDHKRRYK